MINLPAIIKERIERCVAGEDGHHISMDDLAREHGAIALFGTIGYIWGLRPDGTLWQIDQDFGLPFEQLAEEWEINAIVYGIDRYPWLNALLPVRPEFANTCLVCDGRAKFKATVGYIVCSACHGLGWVS